MIIFLSIVFLFATGMWLFLSVLSMRWANSLQVQMRVPAALAGMDAIRKWHARYFFLMLGTIGLLIFFW